MKMNPKEKLLHDILRDASAGFRQELFEASLKALRKRRTRSKPWPGLPLAIAAGFVLSVGLVLFAMAHRVKKEVHAPGIGSLPTTPISAYAHMEMVTSVGPGIAIVESHQYPTLIVQNSDIQQPVETLGDPELLALFPDEPAGLIASSHGTVQLVLLASRHHQSPSQPRF
jgi:hypothetical protein